MNKKILLMLSLMMLPFAINAAEISSPNDTFKQGNQALEKGDLAKAEEIYQSLVGQGFESAELYYNIGNLHYRKGERGKAVLWYERALRLSPRDSDIQFNLSLARSHIKDEETNLFRKIILTATSNELAVATMIFIWIFFGVLGASILGWVKNETARGFTLWSSGFLLVLMMAWFGVNVAASREPLGIVINPPGEVRNGPGTDYAVGFTIPEGSKVVVLNKRPEWVQVGVPSQGLKGWMPNTDVQTIIPNLSLSD